MNIKLKNKFLYFDNYKIKCAVGKRGITSKKKEGDEKTPRGTFLLKSLFYRKDRITKIKSLLVKKKINKAMGWCDDTNSKHYNTMIRYPFNFSAERLWLKENIYDVIVVINYNLKPAIKNKGSAIFLHIAKKNYAPTKGCIAVSLKNMMLILSKVSSKSKIIII